ncbi:MAG TPA: molecular chaperone HscC [Sphingomicrobium sp.]
MIVGIDLGTTNSAVAVWRDGEAVLIPNRLGQLLTPSVVSVAADGTTTCGLAARERQITHPNETAAVFKRYMGSRKTTRLGKTNFLPEELSAVVLRSLKEDAEAFLGEPVTEAVITVPAYFNDKQRNATKRAGELAGFKVERLINEPTAAALAYGIHQRDDESRFLVFDLGGGTFDVSVLEIFEGVIEVRASTGDNRLGGEDFNEVLIQLMRERFAEHWQQWRNDRTLHEHLRDQAERARRALSNGDDAAMEVNWKGESYRMEVTTDQFESGSAKLLGRLREPVLRALRDCKIQNESLSDIVLIGGATRMPMIRRAVARMFGRFPNTGVDPDQAVALGAAIQAGLKSRDSALKEVVLTDVCPYSLGVETARQRPDGSLEPGIFSPVIERNTVIPASRVEVFSTITDHQKYVQLKVFQGEARYTLHNVYLGELQIPVPPAPAGQPIECRFTYDINGILEVDVHVPSSGDRRQLVLIDPDREMSDSEVQKRREMLAKLKVHPRDTEPVRATLARAERVWEQSLGDMREHVGAMIDQFQAALNSQDPRTVEHACREFGEALDRIEGETYL